VAKYILKRLLLAVITIYLVATITFFLMNLVPGGPFIAEKSISLQAQAALKEKFGLDKPLIVQYKNYMLSILHGDFGLSLKQRGRTVAEIIASRFPGSARLGGISVLTALLVGFRWAVSPRAGAAAGSTTRSCDPHLRHGLPQLYPLRRRMYLFGVCWRLPTIGLDAR
jgi:oligopeptide transport system permease protein